MKTTQILIMATFLVAVSACSKQKENAEATSQAPETEIPVMEKPIEAKPTEMLPNEIDAKDMSGINVEQDASGKKVLYWADPMVPDRHFNKSGQSPFMDMKLEPKYAE
jgi:uncharacterized protein YcfL